MENETRLVLLEERVSNLKDQHFRMVSHIESEQRVSVEQGKRIDDTLRRIEHLEKESERQDKNNKHKAILWVSIVALLISILSTVAALFIK